LSDISNALIITEENVVEQSKNETPTPPKQEPPQESLKQEILSDKTIIEKKRKHHLKAQ